MKQETIEQAAKKAIRSGWLCDKGEYPCEDKDKCKFCNGTSKCFGDCGGDAIPYFDGFLDGARWRISSVWHKETEQPDKNQLVLFECRKTYGKGYSVNFGENYPLLKNVILGWAYVADLLPDGKEVKQ